MKTFTNEEVTFLINRFLRTYDTSIKGSMLFIAPLLKAKLNGALTKAQSRQLMTACRPKIKVLHTLGILSAWAIDIYSERVETSGILARVA